MNTQKSTSQSLNILQEMTWLFSVLSLLLLSFRIFHSGSVTYIFLSWNLFLAWLPLVLSTLIIRNNIKKIWKLLVSGIFWVLFLPNAPYIITDLFHLQEIRDFPLWYDTLMILVFASTGLLFWLISMVHFGIILRFFAGKAAYQLSTQALILLTSLGVYLGRFGRWNSWDVFLDPITIIEQVVYMILHPFLFPGFYGMILLFYVFLASIYYFFNKLITNLQLTVQTNC